MPINFNDAENQREEREHKPRYDEAAIKRDLIATANRWVPETFKQGRISSDRSELRCANIFGDPPKNTGSCRIWLTGPNAGEWYDFSGGSGGIFSTIKEHCGLAGGEVFDKAIEILRGLGFNRDYRVAVNGNRGELPQPQPQPQPAAAAPGELTDKQQATLREVGFLLDGAVPLSGSDGERYFLNRVGFVPTAAVDLSFHPNATRSRREARGYPMILSLFRRPSGERSGGLHRTILRDDCSHHIGGDKPKMMLGQGMCAGSVIMLAPLDATATLGIGEGIETALAGSRYFSVPSWATGSARGLKDFGDFLKANGGKIAAGPLQPMVKLQRLLIFVDRGNDGEKCAWALYRAARSVGVAAELYLPSGADDLCDDLAKGLPAPEPQAEPAESRNKGELPPRDGLPTIQVGGGRLAENIDAMEKAIAEHDKEIYEFGDALVRPGLEIVEISRNRKGFASRLIPVGNQHLCDRATRIIDFQKFDKRSEEWVSVDCPANMAQGLIDRTGGLRPNIRYVRGITNSPTLRPDGSLLIKPGYDESMMVLFEPGKTDFHNFEIPEAPTKDQAIATLKMLCQPISEFPFVDEGGNPATGKQSASRSVALAHMLSAIVRLTIPRAPLFGYDATAAGTGKSLLVDTVAMMVTGHECPVISQGGSEEELEKRLGAALLAGDALISFDNCERPLGGEKLNSALSQRFISVRVLGTSKQPSIPSEAIFSATGNNLRLLGDMGRRSLVARLDPKMERPEMRTFSTENPVKEVRKNRAKYVNACLVILRAYEAAGRPPQCVPLGGFEEWSDLIRSALIWLGEPDPCMTMDRTRRLDPRRQELSAVLYGWHQAIGSGVEVTTRRIIEASGEATLTRELNHAPLRWPDFRDALLAVGGERGNFVPRKLGYWLRAVKGRVVDGMTIAEGKVHAGENRWRLDVL